MILGYYEDRLGAVPGLKLMVAYGAGLVLGGLPSRILKNSSVTASMLHPRWNTDSYWARYHLLTL
jgi:hypothetical protein